MSAELMHILKTLIVIVVYLLIGASVAFLFFNLRRRDLFGGYIGGLAIGLIGAIIGGYLLDSILLVVTDFLQQRIGVNVIAGFIGSYAAVYVMNRLNHNKERKKF